jgi:hypothetical protein
MVKTINFNNKEYSIKYYLSNDEFAQFIATSISSIHSQDLPHFITSPLIRDKAICQYYADLSEDETNQIIEVFDDNGMRLVDVIKSNIYYPQLEDIIHAIDEGVKELIKSEIYSDSPDSKVNQILDTILEFSNNLPKWAKKIDKLLKHKDINKIYDLLAPAVMKIVSGNSVKKE